jgi:hypothetical protein
VLTKMRLDLLFRGLDLRVEDCRLGTHGGRVGRRHGERLAQLLGTQRRLDLLGFG